MSFHFYKPPVIYLIVFFPSFKPQILTNQFCLTRSGALPNSQDQHFYQSAHWSQNENMDRPIPSQRLSIFLLKKNPDSSINLDIHQNYDRPGTRNSGGRTLNGTTSDVATPRMTRLTPSHFILLHSENFAMFLNRIQINGLMHKDCGV
jgi:hypothetical protein